MARQKRTSPALDKARTRAAALSSIDAALDVGNGVTLAAYRAQMDAAQTELDEYNALLSQLDAKLNGVKAKERAVAAYSRRILNGVGVKFGTDSDEYEQAGGTRDSDIHRGPRTPTPPA